MLTPPEVSELALPVAMGGEVIFMRSMQFSTQKNNRGGRGNGFAARGYICRLRHAARKTLDHRHINMAKGTITGDSVRCFKSLNETSSAPLTNVETPRIAGHTYGSVTLSFQEQRYHICS
jgi:hypothetical protein